MEFEFDFDGEAFKKDPKASVTEAVNKFVQGLVAKRDELLGKTKKQADALKDFETKLEEANAKVEELSSASGKGQSEAEKELAKIRKESEKLKTEKAESDRKFQDYRKDLELSKAMDAIGVLPEFRDAVGAMFRSQLTVTDEGVVLSDKPLTDSLSEWAKGDKGRVFVAAPANSGGGANGNSNGGRTQVPNPFAKETFNLTQQAHLLKTNPQLAAQFEASAKGSA